MKVLWYALLIAVLVPVQSILLPHLSVWNVKPDLGLVAVCLVGLLAGELDGLLLGLVMGWAMSLFSAEDVGYNMVTKGGIGLIAGLAGRQIAHMTLALLVLALFVASAGSGMVAGMALKLTDHQDVWWALRTVVLPQACFDAVVGGMLYWIISSRLNVDRFTMDHHI
jgi:hypothetical protein